MKKMNLDDKAASGNELFNACTELLFNTQLIAGEILILQGDAVLNILFPKYARKVENFNIACFSRSDFKEVKSHLPTSALILKKNKAITKFEPFEDISDNAMVAKAYSGDDCVTIRFGIGKVYVGSAIQCSVDNKSFFRDSTDKVIADKLMAVLSKDRFDHVENLYDLYIALSHTKNVDVADVIGMMSYRETGEYYNDLEDLKSEQTVSKLYSLWDELTLYSHSTGLPLKKSDIRVVMKAIYKLNSSVLKELENY